MKLGLQLRVAHSPLQRTDGVLDKYMHLAAVAQHGRGIDTGFIDALVHRGLHLAPQRRHARAIHHRVGEFVLAGLDEHQPRRATVIDAELGLQSIKRLLLAGELKHQGMHFDFDALDLLGTHALLG